jgi:hypothetical protein
LTPEVAVAQAQVNKVLEDSGRYFRDGLAAFKATRRSESVDKFNKSVEVFLYSTLNIQKDQKLQTCYSQLIETVYRMEFPSDAQVPQIRSLSGTCGWNWNAEDFKLADAVSQMVKPSLQKQNVSDAAALAAAAGKSIQQPEATVGFNSQEFEPSPLDELSKLQLTPEELGIENRSLYEATTRNLESQPTVVVVRAQAGDTVAKLAGRHGANPTDVAKYNGMLPSSVLGAGREIKLPTNRKIAEHQSRLDELKNEAGFASATLCKSLKPPVIQKLNLGLTDAQVSVRLGRKLFLRSLPEAVEDVSYAAFSGLRGLRRLYLGFYNGKLYRLRVEYDNSIRWKQLVEFQVAVARSLELPTTWRSRDSANKILTCNEFELTASEMSSGTYSLLLEDPSAYARMYKAFLEKRQRAEKEQEERKKSFKP